ncbi:hypothetical protein ACQZOR_06510 [Lactobacillus delbrueckii subsp. bulgaricus]|uniref:hypothetical protein n=1 Tax=Lactobacillus delbrueckii TaxID=1584 RepID=UPI003D2ED0AD
MLDEEDEELPPQAVKMLPAAKKSLSLFHVVLLEKFTLSNTNCSLTENTQKETLSCDYELKMRRD